jgi:hypothetical protein
LSRVRVRSQKGLEELPGIEALPSGRMNQAGEDTMGLKPAWRPGSKTDLAKDDQIPQRLFSLIVGRRDTGNTEEREKVFLLRAEEIFS